MSLVDALRVQLKDRSFFSVKELIVNEFTRDKSLLVD